MSLLLALGSAAVAPAPDRWTGCVGIADPARRLACYDQAAQDALAAARQQQKDDTRTAAERFGLHERPAERARPARSQRPPAVDRIDSVIVSASAVGNGLYAFSLRDGSQWRTQEAGLFGAPHAGTAVVIRRGALGSYRALIGGERPIQAERLR